MRRSSRPARLAGITFEKPQPQQPAFIESTLVRPRATMSKPDAIAQMARDMVEIEAATGGVTADDLHLRGFSAAQVSALNAEAALQAQRLAASC